MATAGGFTVSDSTPVFHPEMKTEIGYAEAGARFVARRVTDHWVLAVDAKGQAG